MKATDTEKLKIIEVENQQLRRWWNDMQKEIINLKDRIILLENGHNTNNS